MNKSVQIKLRDNVEQEKALIEYLASTGLRSGEAKRLLLLGFQTIKSSGIDLRVNVEHPQEKPKPFSGLAVKG
ncbi:hypothetical protein [Vibrio lentus]|uniref:hypothetical protein n=1 Tax=Vibrio lentus TaxID=136468 RepID=UPI000C83E7B2|nr:hypothetical protein [Vibrio lentus]PMM38664.1 hypothetical protein BCT58_00890 [Vibrio lentus]